MKNKLTGTWKIYRRSVQINGNKFTIGQILGKPVEVVKGRILAGWAQKSPAHCGELLVKPTPTGGSEWANSVHCCPPPPGVGRAIVSGSGSPEFTLTQAFIRYDFSTLHRQGLEENYEMWQGSLKGMVNL